MSPNGVYRVIACAESYAEHRGEECPQSLQAMVQAAREWFSPNCIYPFDGNGRSKYGQLRYSPVKSSKDRVIGYSLVFGPRTFFGNLKTAQLIRIPGLLFPPN